MEHHQITFEGKTYDFNPNCPCEGCEGLRRNPTPTKCDWCQQVHCGDSHHCSTKEHGSSNGIRGADQADNAEPDQDREYDDLCDDIRGRIKGITNYIKENYGMKQAITNTPATTAQRNAFEQKGGTKKKRDGFPFLKKETHLSSVKKLFKVLDVREQPDNFKPEEELVMVKIALEGQTLLWPLRYTNPNLATLQEAWGLNEEDWKGKGGSLFIELQEFDGTGQIRVEPDITKEENITTTRRRR